MDKEAFIKRKKVINDLIHDKFYTPMKAKEIAMLLNVSKEDRPELQKVLDALVLEGKIGVSKKGKYGKATDTALVGTFISHQKGFGFVSIEGEEDDVFISVKDVNGALNNDKVQVVITTEKHGDKRREGRILRIIERGTTDIVGTYQNSGKYGFVVPDNQRFSRDIFVQKERSLGAVNGHKVVVKITNYGDDKHNPEGAVIKIIGHINDPGTDIMAIVEGFEIPSEYPQEVMKQLDLIPTEVDPKDYVGRKDLRTWQTVTIDGEDAKDLDDAITISKEGDVYRLGVHIADVSHYVTENSPLDREACNRGTSVYLVDRVIPMLPHKLSNGICSLNQGVDRLSLSCIMDIDSKGNVISHEICESILNVDRRMSYNAVKQIIEDADENTINEYRELVPMFMLMDELAKILRNKRHGRGSIDFDFPESKIRLDDKGVPVEVKAYERNDATKIIEDFMLIANETVAEDAFWQELPFVYRTHDNPDPEKLIALGAFINNFGYSMHFNGDEIHPKEIQKLLNKISGTDEEAMLSRLTLRSMKRAQYTVDCTGHFGLAAKYYTHFTSPIRRYPDLQIHRIIKENLKGGLSEKRFKHYDKTLFDVSKQCSVTERRADDCEREVEKLKKTEYMTYHIGEEFDGVVSGVTAWGIYVELPNTIEGMVHINSLKGDYYVYNESSHELIGETTKITYKLGQRLHVKCVDADITGRTIDFQIVEDVNE